MTLRTWVADNLKYKIENTSIILNHIMTYVLQLDYLDSHSIVSNNENNEWVYLFICFFFSSSSFSEKEKRKKKKKVIVESPSLADLKGLNSLHDYDYWLEHPKWPN